MPAEYKLLFAGPMGAGKTTAIRAISDQAPVSTEAANLDREQHSKDTTTVGLDYGEVGLEDGSRLRLYGLPGQGRFDFMWRILADGALGVIVLIDSSRADALEGLAPYVEAFAGLAAEGRMVIGVSRLAEGSGRIADYGEWLLSRHQLRLPVFSVDLRQRDDVLLLLEALLQQIEIRELAA